MLKYKLHILLLALPPFTILQPTNNVHFALHCQNNTFSFSPHLPENLKEIFLHKTDKFGRHDSTNTRGKNLKILHNRRPDWTVVLRGHVIHAQNKYFMEEVAEILVMTVKFRRWRGLREFLI